MMPFVLLAACTPVGERCPIDEAARDLAGTPVAACGTVGLDESRADAYGCLIDATETGTRAWASFQEQGIDSRLDRAVAFDGTTLFELFRDGDPSGGGGAQPTLTQSTCGSFEVDGAKLECVAPVVESLCN